MSCIEVPHIGDLPGLSLLLPQLSFSLSIPTLDLPCCHFELPPIPGFPILIDVGALLALLLLVPIDVTPILNKIQEAVDQLNLLLDQLDFECPLNP